MHRRTLGFGLLLIFALFLGVYSLSSTQETRFFQDCYQKVRDSCFDGCENYTPTLWDQWSTVVLGERVSRKKTYDSCEAKCLTFAHINCTEQNFERGGTMTFKMFAKYPIKPVWIFEEFCSMVFAVISIFLHLVYYRKYSKIMSAPHSHKAYPVGHLYQAYYIVWPIAFSLAALFHTKDTPLTEKLDYYSAILALLFSVFIAFCRVLWIEKKTHQALIFIPFGVFGIYHIYYMNFVSFDYGYNMKVAIGASLVHLVLWLGWFLKTDLGHSRLNLYAQILAWSSSVFEFFDLPAVWMLLDMHAVWHALGIFMAIVWFKFLATDARHFIEQYNKKGT